MKFSKEIESFIKDFVQELSENNAAIFAGAGLSKSAGFVDWPELMRDIAEDLGLSVDKERDLISLAQYHVDENGGRDKINRKILQEFTQDEDITDSHRIIARLPISTVWTTNYDTLIEDAFEEAQKIVDMKHQKKQLSVTRPKRDVVVYKMHGDVNHSSEATITKEQYETYYKSHEPFITALSGDLTSKTFLFIGFSFTDPNLDYVLGRLNIQFGKDGRQHFCFIKKASKEAGDDEEILKYKARKQELMTSDLKTRYKIKPILIEEYSDIPKILREIERRFQKRAIFISGSAEEYGSWDRTEAQRFIHSLSKAIVFEGFRIVNGFGWGVGSAVINGALEAIYEKPKKFSEDQLIMKPFPQFETGKKTLPEMWEDYRVKMISLAGVAIFIFGNKKDRDGNVIDANGVLREFEISTEKGLIPIPIGATGYVSKAIFEKLKSDPDKYLKVEKWILPKLEELSDPGISFDSMIPKVLAIIRKIKE